MTNREFFSAIINASLSAEISEFAKSEIAKLDAKNEKRRNTPNKVQLANEPIKAQILEALAEQPMVASEIAEKCGISTQKVSALCKQLVADDKVSMADIKVKGKGTVKQYSVVG